MTDGIKSIDELRRAQAAAQAQGTNLTNYNHWAQIMENLEELGVESTGSYNGDLKKFSDVIEKLESRNQEMQVNKQQEQKRPTNDESTKIDDKTNQDKQQDLKANVANNVSSEIMANYMKFYHLM